MGKDSKELLLLKDLYTRIPYGVKICYTEHEYGVKSTWTIDYIIPELEQIVTKNPYGKFSIKDIKPYLRPLSSMTEEEKKEYEKICELDTEMLANHPMNGEPFPALYNSQDWLNKKMFAYRTIDGKDMFELGLALEAPEGMY